MVTLDGYCMHIILNSEGSDFVLKFICVFLLLVLSSFSMNV